MIHSFSMSFFQKLNGFRNPITGARRAIGTCLIILGLVMSIPSIIGFVWSGNIYEKANIYDMDQSLTAGVGNSTVIDASGYMKAGNNYDVYVACSAVGPNTLDQTGHFRVLVVATDLPRAFSESLSRSSFNGSASDSDTTEFTQDFAGDANPVFNFTVQELTDVSSLTVTVKIYENPRRQLVSTMQTISWFLLIPGGLVCCCGCCVAPPGKKD